MSSSALISVRNLKYRYEDGTEALRGIDFELAPGETVALLGANGSGKTTFVLHLSGLLRGEGEISICGMRLEAATLPAIRQKIGLLFQDPDTQLFMPTVLEDVAFGPLQHSYSAVQAQAIALTALEEVGMAAAARRQPYHLSAGEKRRVALAGVLAMEPEVLVLDEPTTYLDPPGQRDLLSLLRSLKQAKIIVTHDSGFACAAATRAVFFDKGRIVASGPVEQVVQQFEWTTRMD